MPSIRDMKQALAKVQPAQAQAVATSNETLAHHALVAIGAVPSNILHMKDVIATSFKYHEALRKNLI